jgi:hypothetical protein
VAVRNSSTGSSSRPPARLNLVTRDFQPAPWRARGAGERAGRLSEFR